MWCSQLLPGNDFAVQSADFMETHDDTTMKRTAYRLAAIAIAALTTTASLADEEGFIPLFDGKSLDGWEVSENKDSFKIEDGAIVAHGPRAHAFYTGAVNGAKFRNFELRLEAMTRKNSNGGVFIHSEYQEKGWPAKGYEIQVNNTQGDWRKTGGLYAVVDNKEPFEDDKWMEMVIRVENGVITSTVNGKKLVEHKSEGEKSKLLNEGGAIALQAHDPDSEVHYKNIRIKALD
jgi:hypothetical protein